MIGKTFIFIGKNIEDDHLNNFVFGEQYIVKSISMLADGDIYGDHQAVIFDNFKYGVLKYNFDKYFVSISDFRNSQILNAIK